MLGSAGLLKACKLPKQQPTNVLTALSTMTTSPERIADNLVGIQDRITNAADQSGRKASDVRLIAVTKYVGEPEVQALLAAGCRDLGESRPQSLWERAKLWPATEVNWHFIGHLQRNKVRRTLPLLHLMHSADSLRLISAMEEAAAAEQCTPSILLEVNISGDPNKHGFAPAELEPALAEIARCENLQVRGLMGMAALDGDTTVAQRNFEDLRKLRDELQTVAPPNVKLDELSMGMSGDFELAIRAGATMVRIGSALFE